MARNAKYCTHVRRTISHPSSSKLPSPRHTARESPEALLGQRAFFPSRPPWSSSGIEDPFVSSSKDTDAMRSSKLSPRPISIFKPALTLSITLPSSSRHGKTSHSALHLALALSKSASTSSLRLPSTFLAFSTLGAAGAFRCRRRLLGTSHPSSVDVISGWVGCGIAQVTIPQT